MKTFLKDLPGSLQYILDGIFKYNFFFDKKILLFRSRNFDEIMFLRTLAISQFISQAAELFLKQRRLRCNPGWVFL